MILSFHRVALAALMNVPRERRIELAGEALGRLVHCPENAYRKSLLCECVSAYLPLDEDQRRQYEEMLRNHPDSGVQAMQTGFLDHIEQRGIELGMQQGMLEGQRELLRQLLEKRFGPLTPSALSSLEAWPSDQLAKLGCDLLTATSLEQLGLDG